MGKQIALIPCTKEKLQTEIPIEAEKLYSTSDLFSKLLIYTKNRKFDEIIILSALHGVLKLDDKIVTYDKTLNNMPKKDKEEWSIKVSKKLNELFDKDDTLVFFTGKNYYKYLLPKLKTKYKIEMEGMTIGKRLRFLKEQNGK